MNKCAFLGRINRWILLEALPHAELRARSTKGAQKHDHHSLEKYLHRLHVPLDGGHAKIAWSAACPIKTAARTASCSTSTCCTSKSRSHSSRFTVKKNVPPGKKLRR